MNTIAIPASFLGILRSALVSELGRVASLIEDTAWLPESERAPEWWVGLCDEFDACRSLLDRVGWTDPKQEVTRFIHLDDDRQVVLLRALKARLEIERDYTKVEPHLRGAARQKRTAKRNVKEIDSFFATTGLKGGE
jgi:hypothetical protein